MSRAATKPIPGVSITAARIRSARTQIGWTQGGLMARSGVNVGSIRDFEADRCKPSQRSLERLAAALGVSVDYLAGTEKPRTQQPGRKDKPELTYYADTD